MEAARDRIDFHLVALCKTISPLFRAHIQEAQDLFFFLQVKNQAVLLIHMHCIQAVFPHLFRLYFRQVMALHEPEDRRLNLHPDGLGKPGNRIRESLSLQYLHFLPAQRDPSFPCISLHEIDDFLIDPNILETQIRCQIQCIKRSAPGQCHIGLARREGCPIRIVNLCGIKRLPLRLMNGNGIRQPDRILAEAPGFLPVNRLFLRIIGVDILNPDLLFNRVDLTFNLNAYAVL